MRLDTHRTFTPFALEREMSRWEKQVEYNISESGVWPITLRELVNDDGFLDELLDTPLDYPHAQGRPLLRERVAALYDGATPENTLMTVGGAGANFLMLTSLLQPGDEAVFMTPNYLQLWGIARNLGAETRTFPLLDEDNWRLDIAGLRRAITPNTRVVCVCNPNNPTGRVLSESEMDAIVEATAQVGAWLLADEVYRGAERESQNITPSFWGRYERVIACGSLSKAYGLPGLRLGWVLAPPDIVEACAARQDYTTITASMLANHLAEYALAPDNLFRIRQRTRRFLREGYTVLEEWGAEQGGRFVWLPPQAGAIAFLRYQPAVRSEEFVRRLAETESTYAAPGAHFGVEQHIRISYGLPPAFLRKALDRVGHVAASFA